VPWRTCVPAHYCAMAHLSLFDNSLVIINKYLEEIIINRININNI
jgi:hypothetical protein